MLTIRLSQSLDFFGPGTTFTEVKAVRSNLFAVLAVLLWATAGALAADHCACDAETAACEHAGKPCAQPDDCTDCFKPAAAIVFTEESVALAPQLKAQAFVPYLSGGIPVICARIFVQLAFFQATVPTYLDRPPAFRAGTMSLRI